MMMMMMMIIIIIIIIIMIIIVIAITILITKVIIWYFVWISFLFKSSSPRVEGGEGPRLSEGGGWCGWKPSLNSNCSIPAFRAQISQFELFELILLLKLDKQFPVERFEAGRAIRGSSVSVSSTLPPSQARRRWSSGPTAGRGRSSTGTSRAKNKRNNQ